MLNLYTKMTSVPTSRHSNESQAPTEIDHSVDFVLVWKPNANPHVETKNQSCRNLFESNLVAEGLTLVTSHIDGIFYIKLIASEELLLRYAEILRFRMPMHDVSQDGFTETASLQRSSSGLFKRLMQRQHPPNSMMAKLQRCYVKICSFISSGSGQFPAPQPRLTAIYSRDKAYLFDSTHPDFLPVAQRSRIVAFVLSRKRYQPSNQDPHAYGITRALASEVYVAAYPLHDGDLVALYGRSMRWRLNEHWASLRNWHRRQPLDHVKGYLGVQIGLYFAWVGFYTYALAVAAIVGCVCFVWAMANVRTHETAQEICASGLLMCPKCDRVCDYWPLRDECVLAHDEAIFDNAVMVAYATFIAFWAILFQTLWQRYSAEITHRWDLTGFDRHEEQPRPEFLANLAECKRRREHYVTRSLEPEPSFWYRRLPARVLSVSVVLLAMALVLACVFGVVMYRVAVLAALQVHSTGAYRLTSLTAACINIVMILVFDTVGKMLYCS